jgi:hypothetical protein
MAREVGELCLLSRPPLNGITHIKSFLWQLKKLLNLINECMWPFPVLCHEINLLQ